MSFYRPFLLYYYSLLFYTSESIHAYPLRARFPHSSVDMEVIRLAAQEEAEERVGEEAADRTEADTAEAGAQAQPDSTSETARRH